MGSGAQVQYQANSTGTFDCACSAAIAPEPPSASTDHPSSAAPAPRHAALAAPASLAYAANPAIYVKGATITPNTPARVGAIETWSITPALPDGLSLNATTGLISGTPSSVAARSD